VSRSLLVRNMTEPDAEKFGMKFLGENEVETALKRLDRLTQDEARTIAAGMFVMGISEHYISLGARDVAANYERSEQGKTPVTS
jgi:hypothetical protein